MSAYQVTIQMDQETVQTLATANCLLGGLVGAQCATTGLPALFFVTPTFGLSTTVAFTPSYLGYASATAATAGAVIEVATAYPVQPGSTLLVSDATGDATVQPPPSGSPSTSPITISNGTTAAIPSSGLAVGTAAEPVALCSFPLAAGTPNVIAPQPLLFLTFWIPSGPAPAPGTALAVSPGAGILVNLAETSAPVVTYQYPEANATYGWSWASTVTGITAYDAGQALPALLNPSAT